MAKHEGLLLKIDSKGNISGYMQENNNKIPIENTTIKNELISFSEEDFEEYSELQNEIRKVYRTYPDESEETVLCAEEGGYTSAGGNGAAVLLFLVLSLREL